MKKSTLNAIMYGVMIVLVIGIIVASISLMVRPEPELVADNPVSETPSEGASHFAQEIPSEEKAELVIVKRVRILSDNINVRTGPGTDYERLGSVYSGFDYDLVEEGEEWTKIIFNGKEAYVYSEYVEIVEMIQNEDGTYEQYIPE